MSVTRTSRLLLTLLAVLAAALLAGTALALQTSEVELGRDGNYDAVVRVARDGDGRLVMHDAEHPTSITLGALLTNSTDHGNLLGLLDDDHPQYLNDDRHTSAHAGDRAANDARYINAAGDRLDGITSVAATLNLTQPTNGHALPSASNTHLRLTSLGGTRPGYDLRAYEFHSGNPVTTPRLLVRPNGTNMANVIQFIPNGIANPGLSFNPQTWLECFGTDYAADPGTYQIFGIGHDGSNALFGSKDVGLGAHSPFLWLFDDQWRVFKIAQGGAATHTFWGPSIAANSTVFSIENMRVYENGGTPSYGSTSNVSNVLTIDREGDLWTTGSLTASSFVNAPSIQSGGVRIHGQNPAGDDALLLHCSFDGNTAAGLANRAGDLQLPVAINGSPAATSIITDASGVTSFGSALTFDGSNDWLNWGDICDVGTSDFTVAFWFRCTLGAAATLLDKRNSGYTGYLIDMTASGQFRAFLGTGSSTGGGIGPAGLDDGTWRHALFAFDRDGLCTLYLNGVAAGTLSIAAAAAQSLDTTDNLYLGRTRDNLNLWNGQLDECALWNRALAPSEVADLWLRRGRPALAQSTRAVNLAQSGHQLIDDRGGHPALGSGQCATYRKGSLYIVAFNDAGTLKYRYLDLASTSATWTYTTTAP